MRIGAGGGHKGSDRFLAEKASSPVDTAELQQLCCFILSLVVLGLSLFLPVTGVFGQESSPERGVFGQRVERVRPIEPAIDIGWTKDLQPGFVPVLIQYDHPPTQADARLLASHRGMLRRQFRIVPALAAVVPEDTLDELRKMPGVVAVEFDGRVDAHDHESVNGVTRIGAERVHRASAVSGEPIPSILGTGVKVAILDSGIDYNHFELADNYRGGFDFVNNNSDPWDDNGHGTAVAGAVAARWNNSGIVGVAPQAELYALKVLGSDGSGNWSAIISALDWCVANNIQVVNLSLGSELEPSSTVRRAFRRAHDAGMVLIASAGNNGNQEAHNVSFPARYATVIAVGGISYIREDLSFNGRASFSSSGAAVELMAPGSFIRTTLPGNRFDWVSGTSIAAPHVAGTAALMIEAGVADWNGNGRINDDVRLVLQLTAEDLGAVGRDPQTGFGLVDAWSATVMAYIFGGTHPPAPPPKFDAPTNLLGTADNRGVSLAWQSNSTVETGFEVQVGVDQEGQTFWEILEVTQPGVTSLAIPLPAGSYRFRVRALRHGEVSGWSNQIDLEIDSAAGGVVASVSYHDTGRRRRLAGESVHRDLTIHVAISNEDRPLSGAIVSGRLRNVTTNQTWSFRRRTNRDGLVTVLRSNAPLGQYRVELDQISHPEHSWNGSLDDPGHQR